MAEPAYGPDRERWDRDALAAALAGGRFGRPLVVVGEAESTNDLAWAEARRGAADGLLVVAESQTRGRGRGGSLWHSPPGVGILASFLVRPSMSPPHAALVPLAAAVALAEAAESAGVVAGLKWPNDLVRGVSPRRKLGGVLVESRAEADGRWMLVVGIGLNVNASEEDFPPSLRPIVSSIALETGSRVDRVRVLVALAAALERGVARLEAGETESVLAAWRARAALFGKPVRVRGGGAEVQGIARDLAADGALVVRLDSGVELAVHAGEVDVLWEAGGRHG